MQKTLGLYYKNQLVKYYLGKLSPFIILADSENRAKHVEISELE